MSEDSDVSVDQTDDFARGLNELNRRMVKLPMTARRANWGYYYRRLAELNGVQHVKNQPPPLTQPDQFQ